MSFHQTIVSGYLAGDPEIKYMQNGKSVCNFSIAVNEKWKSRNGGQDGENTTWYNVSVWGPQSESCSTYLNKGSIVTVVGNVKPNAYINKNGEAVGVLNLNAFSVKFLFANNNDNANGNNVSQQQNRNSHPAPSNTGTRNLDDIPF